jgi:hypothetical protein
MQLSNEGSAGDGGLPHLLLLQSEYQAALTTETLKYLRGVQAAFSPRPPGTIVQANGVRLTGAGCAGGYVGMRLDIGNRQRVHASVSPAVTPLVNDEGCTWYPSAELEPVAILLGPDDTQSLSITLALPEDLPAGTYRGSLVLLGFIPEGVPIAISVDRTPGEVDAPVVTT